MDIFENCKNYQNSSNLIVSLETIRTYNVTMSVDVALKYAFTDVQMYSMIFYEWEVFKFSWDRWIQ